MGTVVQVFFPRDALYPPIDFVQYNAVDGTNFPVESLAFDSATEEHCYFVLDAVRYASGNVTCKVRWYVRSGAVGLGVAFGASLAVITPHDTLDVIQGKNFATEVVASDSNLGTMTLHELPIVVNQLGGLAADDFVMLRLARKVGNAADDLNADCLVVEVRLEYSDT